MAIWTPPPPPNDPVTAVEGAVNDAVDEGGKVIDAVSDAVQGDGGSGGGGGPPDPIEPIAELFTAVQTFADNASQIVNQIASGTENAIGTVADGVSDTLSRGLPIVIGFLSDVVGLGGVGTKVAGLIDRVASKVDQVVSVVTNPGGGGKTDGGPPPPSDSGNGLRELSRSVNRDPAWRKQYLKRSAYQLAVRPRAPIAKGALGTALSGGASKSSDGGAAAAQRMLARLATLDEKLRRLELLLASRVSKSAPERAAFTRVRMSLSNVVQEGGARLASKATLAKASIAAGLVKGKL